MVRSDIIPLLIALWTVASGQATWAQNAESAHFAAVVRYWEWSAYWSPNGLDFPSTKYRPGMAFSALVFYSEPVYLGAAYWGFCSRQLGVCQSYFAWPAGSVQRTAGIRMRKGESARAAFRRFQKQEFQNDEDAKFAELMRHSPRLLAGLAAGTTPRADGAQPGSDDEVPVRTVVRTIRLPALQLPEAVRRRFANRFVEEFVRAREPEGCSVIFLYADTHAPLVPVLYLCPGSKGIQFMTKSEKTWYETAGGWMADGVTVRQFEPRIRKYASLLLKP